ncbi:MAG: hypothetical protein JWO32_170 [Bacteroidetes bacterium]|nr:hypothetical protein [Bacteroidota bacterium]
MLQGKKLHKLKIKLIYVLKANITAGKGDLLIKFVKETIKKKLQERCSINYYRILKSAIDSVLIILHLKTEAASGHAFAGFFK